MNYWLNTSICFLIFLLGQSQVGLAVGPIDPDASGPPSCGADGICRINECKATPDPDCPKLPTGSPGNTIIPTDVPHLSNQPVPSAATSGKTPTNKTLAKEASSNDAVYSVTIGEDSDDPCYMEIKYRDVATLETQSSLKFSECAGHKVGDLLTTSLPRGAFATGVRICLNSDGDKLKGIQLIGAYDDCVLGAESVKVPSSCSSVHNFSGIEYRICDPDAPPFKTVSCNIPISSNPLERPNCPGSKHDEPDNDWEKIVSCPPKMVATGMKLRTIDGSGKRKMIDGVSLVCDTLVPPN